VKGFDFIRLENQDFQSWEIAEHFYRAKLIASEIELSKLGELTLGKHILEILQIAFFQLELHNLLTG
jgi:hypothetical protein